MTRTEWTPQKGALKRLSACVKVQGSPHSCLLYYPTNSPLTALLPTPQSVGGHNPKNRRQCEGNPWSLPGGVPLQRPPTPFSYKPSLPAPGNSHPSFPSAGQLVHWKPPGLRAAPSSLCPLSFQAEIKPRNSHFN